MQINTDLKNQFKSMANLRVFMIYGRGIDIPGYGEIGIIVPGGHLCSKAHRASFALRRLQFNIASDMHVSHTVAFIHIFQF